MSNKNITLLVQCIKHWSDVIDGSNEIGVDHCALCKEYDPRATIPCDGCPVAIDSGENYCRGTPYHLAAKEVCKRAAGSSFDNSLIVAERDYLLSLLCKEPFDCDDEKSQAKEEPEKPKEKLYTTQELVDSAPYGVYEPYYDGQSSVYRVLVIVNGDDRSLVYLSNTNTTFYITQVQPFCAFAWKHNQWRKTNEEVSIKVYERPRTTTSS